MTAFFQDPKLDAFITRTATLKGVTGISHIHGGLTNKNYRINTEINTYFLRVNDNSHNSLGIDREHERINAALAFKAGIGPAVIDSSPEDGLLLISWIDAKTLHAEDLQGNAPLLKRIACSLRQLHAGPAFEGKFHFPCRRKNYLNTVLNNNYFLPEGYLQMEPFITALEDTLALLPEQQVPCHNDLLAENFMDDGEKIWIIDYEYSGQNEPSFEIGNLASESWLSVHDLSILCTAYWQQDAAAKLYRALAWSMVARFGWMAWASIQDAVSKIDFDYRSWGLRKWNSVLPELKSDYYHEILHNIKQ